MDTLVQKAWELYQHTARFPVETVLTATFWLEEKHRKMPGEKLPMAIALHYLILALRNDPGIESGIAQEYCAHAARRQAKACESSTVAPASKATEETDEDSNRSRH
jgi:hypothetical protein